MARPGAPRPRLHRLPQRLDYTLIPAPLDLSLPLITEKSPLPAIIVTPSSPSDERHFSIAFLAPPPKPTIRERLSSFSSSTFSVRARTALLLFVIGFVMVCHLIAHKMAARTGRPHLDFGVQTQPSEAGGSTVHGHSNSGASWFNSFLSGGPGTLDDADKRDFIVIETL
ncbi:hypothetical protein PQX77_001053 [Marasmius sp. AFHP31]|nr:hypothetical protein PQX77_001053 [Marasmius sp. AFHP31]